MFYSKDFNMGQVCMTNGIREAMRGNDQFVQEIFLVMKRFSGKDWGELCEEDKQMNEDSLENPEDIYLFGEYQTSKGKIFIITNRVSEEVGKNQVNATTVMFPDER